jgi:Fe-S cluster assembly ATPase SufC
MRCAKRAARPPLDAFDFLGSARTAATRLGLPEAMLARPVNDGFSGGERKRNELLQLALLQPRLAVLDEIDSGMDVDGVRAVVAAGAGTCARAARPSSSCRTICS